MQVLPGFESRKKVAKKRMSYVPPNDVRRGNNSYVENRSGMFMNAMMSPLMSPKAELFQNFVSSNSRSIASTTKNRKPDPGSGFQPTQAGSGLAPISSELSNYQRILEIHKHAENQTRNNFNTVG